MAPRLTTRGVVGLIVGALLTLTGILIGLPELTILAISLALFIVSSYLGMIVNPIRLSVSSSNKQFAIAHVGQNIEIETTVFNQGRFKSPTFTLSESLQLSGTSRTKTVRSPSKTVNKNDSLSLKTNLKLEHRGIWNSSFVTVETCDIGGFVKRIYVIFCDRELVCIPPRHQLPSFIPPETNRSTHSLFNSSMNVLAGIRKHRLGDEMRLVHWKQSARRGELIVKEFETETQSRAVLLIDDSRANVSERDFESMVELAMAMVEAANRAQFPLQYVRRSTHNIKLDLLMQSNHDSSARFFATLGSENTQSVPSLERAALTIRGCFAETIALYVLTTNANIIEPADVTISIQSQENTQQSYISRFEDRLIVISPNTPFIDQWVRSPRSISTRPVGAH